MDAQRRLRRTQRQGAIVLRRKDNEAKNEDIARWLRASADSRGAASARSKGSHGAPGPLSLASRSGGKKSGDGSDSDSDSTASSPRGHG